MSFQRPPRPHKRNPPPLPRMSNREHRILSRPIGVWWMGFESNTMKLQQHGWEIAAEYSMYGDNYRLLFRHNEMHLYAITHAERLEHMITRPEYDLERLPVFRVQGVVPQIEVIRMMDDLSSFQQIDAQPCMTKEEITRVEDMNIFRVPMERAEEIVVDKADMTVIEHLEAIKKLQQPRQKEIRQRMVSAGESIDISERTEVIANIVNFHRRAS